MLFNILLCVMILSCWRTLSSNLSVDKKLYSKTQLCYTIYFLWEDLAIQFPLNSLFFPNHDNDT